MPFILFLKAIGVTFAAKEDALRGIELRRLETILMSGESNHPLCSIRDEQFGSLLKHLRLRHLLAQNQELRAINRLVAEYKNVYGEPSTTR
jgi:hypothetical protein